VFVDVICVCVCVCVRVDGGSAWLDATGTTTAVLCNHLNSTERVRSHNTHICADFSSRRQSALFFLILRRRQQKAHVSFACTHMYTWTGETQFNTRFTIGLTSQTPTQPTLYARFFIAGEFAAYAFFFFFFPLPLDLYVSQ
jgi:hypothetical protein